MSAPPRHTHAAAAAAMAPPPPTTCYPVTTDPSYPLPPPPTHGRRCPAAPRRIPARTGCERRRTHSTYYGRATAPGTDAHRTRRRPGVPWYPHRGCRPLPHVGVPAAARSGARCVCVLARNDGWTTSNINLGLAGNRAGRRNEGGWLGGWPPQIGRVCAGSLWLPGILPGQLTRRQLHRPRAEAPRRCLSPPPLAAGVAHLLLG